MAHLSPVRSGEASNNTAGEQESQRTINVCDATAGLSSSRVVHEVSRQKVKRDNKCDRSDIRSSQLLEKS
jgi:hypothetical protein